MKGTKQNIESLYSEPIRLTVADDYVALWNSELKFMATKDEFMTDGLEKDIEITVRENRPDVNLMKGLFYLFTR